MADFSVVASNAGFLSEGLLLSLGLTLAGVAGGLAVGTLLSLARIFGGRPGNALVDAYVFLFRAIPLILVIFWFYFMVPLFVGHPIGALESAIVTFALFEGAYYSEIIRAGIRSVRPGQMNAALACGMSRAQALRHIVLPQAFITMIPVFFTQAIVLLQDTSLVFVVSLHDFLTSASIVANRDGHVVEIYGLACLVYYVVCLVATTFVERLKRKVSR
jgi:glutamate/aspartate transport system permease protein